MVERRFSEDEPVMVSIRCITYNHAPYIRQCLEGFVMQKTNFRFQAIVHDDASTDGTTEIVREYAEKYPDIIVPIYETENQWSKHDGSLLRCMLPLMTGKYWAECEGDDYWIDPLKLQKQVDFMESHPDYGMCHTNFDTTIGRWNRNVPQHDGDNYLQDMLDGQYQVGMATTLCVKSLREKYSFPEVKFSSSDVQVWLQMAHAAKIKYLEDVTAVYRILSNSLSHSSDIKKELSFFKSTYNCRKYYADKYGKSCKGAAHIYILSSMKCAYKHGDKEVARALWKEMKEIGGYSWKAYLLYLGTMIKPFRWLLSKYYRVG